MTKQNCKDNCAENEQVNNGASNVDESQNCDSNVENCVSEEELNDSVSDESVEVGDKSAELSVEIEIWRDKYLRLSAEFDNYRKRTLKEKMDLITSGGEGVMKTLLPTLDDLDRAMKAIDVANDTEALKEGVVLITNKLNDALKSKGLMEIEALGLPLNTDMHEAIAKFAVEDEEKGLIIDVLEKGYMLNDKVVRYAKVVVGE